MATEVNLVPALVVNETGDAIYARINMADGKTRVVGHPITPEQDVSAARAQCARELADHIDHYVRTGVWL